jgi:ferredoxin
MAIARVWIEDGCICCQACVQVEARVFAFPDDVDRAIILGDVRLDGASDNNELARSVLNAVGTDLSDQIEEAAAGCPVEVIRFIAA